LFIRFLNQRRINKTREETANKWSNPEDLKLIESPIEYNKRRTDHTHGRTSGLPMN
jgi:hypothetical protein